MTHMPGRRRVLTSLAVALLAGTVLGGEAVAAPAPSPDGTAGASTPGPLLPAAAQGRAALRSLGGRTPLAAARSGIDVATLTTALRTDPTLWLDRAGRLHVKDPVPLGTAPASPSGSTTGTVTTAATTDPAFLLHSRPGAPRVIYLDFDGATGLAGSAWAASYPTIADSQPAFDIDGDATTFSPAELAVVTSVFHRVAEDYAPFDVDVTTEDPGADALIRTDATDTAFGTRALITPSDNAAGAICGGGCGGVAYVGTFDATDSGAHQPAWIFSHLLGNDAKNIAEAVSHEVGHNLGLLHDGTSAQGYYAGQGDWAPIMGVGYDRPVVQWSRGEYADANNQQDDLTVITDNGVAQVTDDIGDSRATATPWGARTTLDGLIGTRSDVDVVAVAQQCTGVLTAGVEPSAVSPDLDARLRLIGKDGTVLASDDPASATAAGPDVASGLSAQLSRTLAAGTYYVEVDGVGSGDPASTGYSDYASIGPYTLTVDRCTPSTGGTRSNLLRNSGFERDGDRDRHPDRWTRTSAFTWTSVVHQSGRHAGRLTATDDRTHRVAQGVTGVTGGTSYNAGAWVRIPVTRDSFTFQVVVQWRSSAGRLLRTDVVHRWRAGTGGWRAAARILTSPARARRATVQLVATSLRTTVYTDTVTLRPR